VIVKALIGVEPHIVNNMNRASKSRSICFELFGFDILLDEALKPWLLEVNVSPSLSSSSPLDRRIKTTLLCDVFNLVGFIPYDRRKLDQELETNRNARLMGRISNRPFHRNT
jgi:tubulin polyglutamylase TTLL4